VNLRRTARSLDPEEWMLLGYLFACLVWWLAESWPTATSQSARRDAVQQVGGYDRVELGEQALERIERGETVAVDRWHGGAIQLQGDVVIDAEEIVEEQPDEEDVDE